MHSRDVSRVSPPPTGSGNHRYFMGYLFFLLCMICWMMYGCISCELEPRPPLAPLHTQTRRISSSLPLAAPSLPLPLPLPLRLEDPLRHQLRQGRLLALPDPDRLLLPLDVLDVPQQRLPLHVGGGAHHVSALPGPTRLDSHRRPRRAPSPSLCPRRLIYRCLVWFFFLLPRSQLWASPPTRG